MKASYKIDRDWLVKEKHIPILKKLDSILRKQTEKLKSRDFAEKFYSENFFDENHLTEDDCYFLLISLYGYLTNYEKSLGLLIFNLENAPRYVQNSLALQTRSLIEISGILFYIDSKENVSEQLNIVRIRRLFSLAEKIQMSDSSETELRKAYTNEYEEALKTSNSLEEYSEPELLTSSKFKKIYGRSIEHVESIRPVNSSAFSGRLTDSENNYYWGMYKHLSNFVHGDPLSNHGAVDQPIWFSVLSIPLTCITIELLDENVFGNSSKKETTRCKDLYDECAPLIRNLAPIEPNIINTKQQSI